MNIDCQRVAVLAAGNGGQALAAALALKGCKVRLWNRSEDRLLGIRTRGSIRLTGAIEGETPIDLTTSSLKEAVEGVDLIFVASTADAHAALAAQLAPLLRDGQTILLNPGRTGGAMEFRAVLTRVRPSVRVRIAEAQSLVFACRIEGEGIVRVIGIKKFVPVAALPRSDTAEVLSAIRPLFPSFVPAEHVLWTSFENIGSIFHPSVLLFNAAAIERGAKFFFYQDMTPAVAEFLLTVDEERLRLGRAFGMRLLSITEWIKKAYPETRGESLCDLMRNNPAYFEIRAPSTLDSRLLTEDIPTGLVPFVELGRAAGLRMPLMESLIHIGSALLKRNFFKEGRTLHSLGIENLSVPEILKTVTK